MDLNNVKFDWLVNYPNSWKLKKVKYVFYLSKNKVDNPEGYPILSLTMKGIIFRDVSTNEGQLPDNFDGYTLLENEDIVFNPMDLVSGWVDKSEMVGLISPSYKVLRTNHNDINRDYYKYYFQTHYTEKIFFPFGEGVHYQYRWGLGSQTLLNFPILVPPKDVQDRIVDFLNEKISLVDKLIILKQKKINLLKEQKNSLINYILTKGLVLSRTMKESNIENVDNIPKDWEVINLKYLVEFDCGYSFNSSEYQNEGVNLIRIGNLYDNKLDLERSPVYLPKDYLEKYQNFVVNENDILISLTGTLGKRDYGYSIVYNKKFPSLLNQRVGRLKLISNIIHFNLFTYILHSEYFLNQLFCKPTGTKQGNFSSEDIVSNFIIIPSMEEQNQIVEYLDTNTNEIENLIDLEQKKIDLFKEYRQSLISEVVTGKIKVTTNE
jgi:type I restriction enzyme S subunit